MVTQILLYDKNNYSKCFRYHVHDFHECDMIDFLLNHDKKTSIINPEKKDIKWFSFFLTKKDIEIIKKTTWYKNLSFYKKDLEKQLVEGIKLEFIIVNW